jgi:hypothetical protein
MFPVGLCQATPPIGAVSSRVLAMCRPGGTGKCGADARLEHAHPDPSHSLKVGNHAGDKTLTSGLIALFWLSDRTTNFLDVIKEAASPPPCLDSKR